MTTDKPYNIKMLTREIIVILFTQGLPYAQFTKNRVTCKNYIANYKIFQEQQLNSKRFPVFPAAISSCSTFPAAVDTMKNIS